MLRLVAHYSHRLRSFPLPAEERHLGTGEECGLQVPFPGVSRRHCKVQARPGGVLLTDLGSTNGLVVDGERLTEVFLAPGGSVRLGHATLTLEEVSSSEGETALEIRRSESDSAIGLGDDDTDEVDAASAVASATPAMALQLVRWLELDGQSLGGDRLRAAGEALGARTLLLFSLDPSGDIVLLETTGEMLKDAELDALPQLCMDYKQRSSLPEPPVSVVIGEPPRPALLAVRANPVDPHLLAVLPQGANPEAWQEDFFAYLGEKAQSHADVGGEPVSQEWVGASQVAEAPDDELRFPGGTVIGASPAMERLLKDLRAAVHSDLNVLLLGETGTGKEHFARMIHASGPQARGPFVAINCAAIPGELLEAELFGVAARVATGVDPRPGLFVQAHNGAIFLDEIGDMPERLQAKMLRVLQEREVLPLGGAAAKKVNARVIAASNRNLEGLVAEGAFRADLYYRLRGLQFHIPPLRERREEIPQLVLAFAERSAVKYKKRVHGVSRRALRLLTERDWPGNIRELESDVERAVLLCADGGTLESEHFSGESGRRRQMESPLALWPAPPVPGPPLPDPRSLQEQLDEIERQVILSALAAAKGNKSKAAKALAVTRNGLAIKMRRLKVS